MEQEKNKVNTMLCSTSLREEDVEACRSVASPSSIYAAHRQHTNETLGREKTESSNNNTNNNINRNNLPNNKCAFFSSFSFYKKKEINQREKHQNDKEKINDTTEHIADMFLAKSKYSEMHKTAEVQNAAKMVLNKRPKNVNAVFGILIFIALSLSLASFIGFLYVGRKISNAALNLEKSNKQTSFFYSRFLPLPLFFPTEQFHNIPAVLLQLDETERALYRVSSVRQNLKRNETVMFLQSGESFHMYADEAILYDKDKNLVKKWNNKSIWENEANVLLEENDPFFDEIKNNKNLLLTKKRYYIDENNVEDFSKIYIFRNNTYPLFSSSSVLKEVEEGNDYTGNFNDTIAINVNKKTKTKEETDENLLLHGFPVNKNGANDKVFFDGDDIVNINNYFHNSSNNKFAENEEGEINYNSTSTAAKTEENAIIDNTQKSVFDNNNNTNTVRRLLQFVDIFNLKSLLLNDLMSTTARAADSIASVSGALVQPTLNFASSNPFSSLANTLRMPYAMYSAPSRLASSFSSSVSNSFIPPIPPSPSTIYAGGSGSGGIGRAVGSSGIFGLMSNLLPVTLPFINN